MYCTVIDNIYSTTVCRTEDYLSAIPLLHNDRSATHLQFSDHWQGPAATSPLIHFPLHSDKFNCEDISHSSLATYTITMCVQSVDACVWHLSFRIVSDLTRNSSCFCYFPPNTFIFLSPNVHEFRVIRPWHKCEFFKLKHCQLEWICLSCSSCASCPTPHTASNPDWHSATGRPVMICHTYPILSSSWLRTRRPLCWRIQAPLHWTTLWALSGALAL